mmetsp:Transcript_32316/g.77502  ORF Transcript_32316/g.77502 Transcript_32316/m.77502 type:complete len:258 (+) Transcript_32316:64-837(+)
MPASKKATQLQDCYDREPYKGRYEMDNATCLQCVPLRLGVFTFALLGLIYSGTFFMHFELMEMHTMAGGGYCHFTRAMMALLALIGIPGNWVGMVAIWTNNNSTLKSFSVYQGIRVGGGFLLFVVDLAVLSGCEMYRFDVSSAVHQYTWNETMYRLAMNMECGSQRIRLIVGFLVILGICVYGLMITAKYSKSLSDEHEFLSVKPAGFISSAHVQSPFARPGDDYSGAPPGATSYSQWIPPGMPTFVDKQPVSYGTV